MKIGNFLIEENQPCFIIAEAGVNHNGDLDIAFKLIEEAKRIGSDCIKFQTFKAKSVITKNAPKANYQLKVTNKSESQFEMLKKLELSKEDFENISNKCKEVDIQFLSTPYNKEDADLLNDIGVDAFKIASGQIVELSFLKYVAAFQKPMIISTGMANLSEIDEAVNSIREINDQIVLLQCTTNYPSNNADANINAMQSLKHAFNTIVGYSDHVPNNYAAYASIALGAKVVEKHFTLDKNMEGPDHKASLDVKEFETFINGVKLTEQSLGSSIKYPTKAEQENIEGMRRSIVAKEFIPAGTIITDSLIEFKRPATGLKPQYLPLIIGKKTSVDIEEDSLFSFKMIEW